jgi:hypothetical protein
MEKIMLKNVEKDNGTVVVSEDSRVIGDGNKIIVIAKVATLKVYGKNNTVETEDEGEVTRLEFTDANNIVITGSNIAKVVKPDNNSMSITGNNNIGISGVTGSDIKINR